MKMFERLRDVVRDVLRPTIFDPHDRLRPTSEVALGLLSMPFELRDYLSRDAEPAPPKGPAAMPKRSSTEAPGSRLAGEAGSGAAITPPPGFVYALDAEAVREGRPVRVEIAGLELALYRVGEAFYASDDACPHAKGPLSEGDQEGACVICPLHGWAFDLQTGRCTNIETAQLRTYPCRRVGEAIYVALT